MNRNKKNINLVCLFKGINIIKGGIEQGGYVDALLCEPYSLANAYLKSYAEKFDDIKSNYNIVLINLSDKGRGIVDCVTYQEEFIECILSNHPYAIGFSTYCWNIDTTLLLVRKIKRINPRIKILIGGRYALKEYLLRYPEIDFIVKGEGEIPFVKLLKNNLKKPANIPGVSYLYNGHIVDNGDAEIIKDIDEIPSPYLKGIIKPNKYNMMLELSRGCLNNCGYCRWNSNKTYRYHSKKRIYQELLFAKQNKLKHITIVDSAINYEIKLLRYLSDVMTKLKSRILFSYNLRHELIDVYQIQYLKNIPTFQALIGMESINSTALKICNRKISSLRVFENSVKLLNYYCEPLVGVILGLPGDTADSFKETINYLERVNSIPDMKIGMVLISLLQVFPDSLLYKYKNVLKIKTYTKGTPYIISNFTWKKKQLKDVYLWLQDFKKYSKLQIKGIEGEWTLK